MWLRGISSVLLVGATALAVAAGAGTGWHDVLDSPATESAQAMRGLFNGLARAGDRIVAVGQRGHVLWSDDQGVSWHQAQVPVSSDLLAVTFVNATHGWAVGHDGVVLHSRDGGRSWTRQLDGQGLGPLLQAFYNGGDRSLSAAQQAFWQGEAARIAVQGAENSWLDVWFQDEQTGYVVGSFGLMLRTRDGGAHWEPMMHALANPKSLHLYALRRVGDALYIVGEQGLVLQQAAGSDRFRALPLPYQGTLFGMTGNDRVVLVYGLRGHALRSTDAGASWQSVDTGVQVGLTSSTVGRAGEMVLVSQAGHALVSTDDGASFHRVPLATPQPAAAVVEAGSHRYVIAGPRGVSAQVLR